MATTLDAPPPTTIEAPRPEPLPFCWPSQDLKNLVQLAPLSPYTRALLRIKFNRPVPDGCTTFEQIESWLATLPTTSPTPPPACSTTSTTPQMTYWERQQAEIDRGEYIEVEATMDGTETQYVSWSKSGTVQVPLSVWEDGETAVKEYVRDDIEECDMDYGDTEYGDTRTDNFEIEDDLDDLMAEAETMIQARDGEEDDDE
jgi:hypothetical protein